MESLLSAINISKRFGGVQALENVMFELKRGEVHGLVGENGAGKSTLIKIICGICQKDSGSIFYNGKEINFKSNIEARLNGIGIVPQEIQLALKLSVAENIFMGLYPKTMLGFVKWKELYQRAYNIAKTFKIEDLIRVNVEKIGTGYRQLLEILKALIFNAEIIAFDEPTASLSGEEARELFSLINKLKSEGVSIIYVSHRLNEIFEIADTVTVLKDGKYIGSSDINKISKDKIISMMVGRELNLYVEKISKKVDKDRALFSVHNLNRKNIIKNITFKLFKGEILGLFGIVGSGRTETVMAIFGVEHLDVGDIFIKEKKVLIRSPMEAVKLGIGLVPENRISQGVILRASIKNNITLPFIHKIARIGFINSAAEHDIVHDYMKFLSIKAQSDNDKVNTLSGGNQQKVAIAKWLAAKSDIIIFDEPTHGIDVGSKSEIHKLLRELATEGKGVIIISSELQEIINICDRILVFREGSIAFEFTTTDGLREEDVLQYSVR